MPRELLLLEILGASCMAIGVLTVEWIGRSSNIYAVRRVCQCDRAGEEHLANQCSGILIH